jgi:stress response protein SCP2
MGDFVFHGSENQTKLEGEDEPRPYSSDGSVYGAIDETEGDDDGDDDEGDTEDMRIYFDRVADHIKEIVVVVTITKYPNDEHKDKRTLDLDMSQVKGCYCRIIDDSSQVDLCKYTLSDDFGNEDAVEVGKFSKNSAGDWEFMFFYLLFVIFYYFFESFCYGWMLKVCNCFLGVCVFPV